MLQNQSSLTEWSRSGLKRSDRVFFLISLPVKWSSESQKLIWTARVPALKCFLITVPWWSGSTFRLRLPFNAPWQPGTEDWRARRRGFGNLSLMIFRYLRQSRHNCPSLFFFIVLCEFADRCLQSDAAQHTKTNTATFLYMGNTN